MLRQVIKTAPGHYLLRALNRDYQDLPSDEKIMRTFASLKAVLDPLELAALEPV